ncbi:MAG: VWA domain-containing protein [Acidimicrobiales bacterium]
MRLAARRVALALIGTMIGLGVLVAEPVGAVDGADDDRIQILGASQDDDGEVRLEIALPASIGALQPVAGNFGVTEDGRLVDARVAPITSIVDVIVVLDTSGSMAGPALVAARNAAATFIDQLAPDARVAVISFGETAQVEAAPGVDHATALEAVRSLSASGETALWDALVLAAEVAASSGADRPYVVVLSDGDDTVSAADRATVVARLGEVDAALYAIAIESPDADLVALDQVVGELRGEFVATTGTGELERLYVDVADRLGNRYELRYSSASTLRRAIVVSVAVDDAVATASTSFDPGRSVAPDAPSATEPTATGPAEAAQSRLATRPGPFDGGVLLTFGLVALFIAFAVIALLVTVPAAGIRLGTASGADRVVGLNDRLSSAANRFVVDHDSEGNLDRSLDAAGIGLRPGEFLLLSLAAITTTSLLVSLVAGPVVGGLAALVGAVLVYAIVTVRTSRRRAAFADQLTDTITIVTGGLRAGRGLPQAIELVSQEAPSPTAEQFRRIVFETRVGRDLTTAMLATAERMDNDDLQWIARAVDINRELGGDLTELLDNLADTIRDRRRVTRQVQALSAEGRASGWVLLGLPVVMFGVLAWRTPDNVALLTGTPLGVALLTVAAVGMLAGFVWIRKLVDLKY